ncbi:hypothetical protein KY309_00015 [Candidatus Woesearchaeota archaeon]|nr:hypothetical protein [Candidatus Woesearchaeota archaeon]MBW3015977.1 hypothetical protein [Candidatus Woesearchaeota archaeon]
MTVKTEYTRHSAEFSYDTQYPDWEKLGFVPGESVYVGQGKGGLSISGNPLQSDGFSFCSALIIKNTQTLDAALFHIDSIDLNYPKQTSVIRRLVKRFVSSLDLSSVETERLCTLISAATRYWNPASLSDNYYYSSEEKNSLIDRMTELNKDGIIRACYVLGDISRDVKFRVAEGLFKYLGIDNIKDILVDTGRVGWDIGFKPRESKVLVNSRKQHKVLSYSF